MYHQLIDSSHNYRQLKLPHMVEKAFWDRLNRQGQSALANTAAAKL
jgi:hypothetical protein